MSEEDYHNNRVIAMESLPWQEETTFTGWLKDVPVYLKAIRIAYDELQLLKAA